MLADSACKYSILLCKLIVDIPKTHQNLCIENTITEITSSNAPKKNPIMDFFSDFASIPP